MNKDEIEPLSEVKSSFMKDEVTPKDLLKFAKWILGIISIIFIGSCFSELLKPSNMVFEICKTILPSLTTLIIGYYFGKS